MQSLAIARQHLSIIRQTAWVVLRVDRSAQGKIRTKSEGQAPYVDPTPEKVGVN